MRPDVERWLQRRTSAAADWPLDGAARGQGRDPGQRRPSRPRRGGHRRRASSSMIAAELLEAGGGNGLVDELVVIDSGSADATADRRRARPGPSSCTATTCCPAGRPVPGKGEVLWRSLAATTGDVARLRRRRPASRSRPAYVTGLLGPLLTDRAVALVKGFYDRPLRRRRPRAPDRRRPGHRAGRAPAAQPALARAGRGGPAARRRVRRPARAARAAARSRPATASSWPCSSTPSRWPGWTRSRRSTSACGCTATRTTPALGRMAARSGRSPWPASSGPGGVRQLGPVNPTLAQFDRADGLLRRRTHDVELVERPPMVTVPEYTVCRAARGRS